MSLTKIWLQFLLGIFLIGCKPSESLITRINQRCDAKKLFSKVFEEAKKKHALSYYGSTFFVSVSEEKLLFTVVDESTVNEFIAFMDLFIESYCKFQDTYFLFVSGKFSKDGIKVGNIEIIDESEITRLYEAYNYKKLGRKPTLEEPINFNPFSFLFKKEGKDYNLIESGTHLSFPL